MRNVEFKPVLLTEESDIFSIVLEHGKESEFQKFLIMFKDTGDQYIKEDFDRILAAIEIISQNGALESYFRNEGRMTDRICAIPLLVKSRDKARHGTLRLYCIRISDSLLIIGGGGIKTTEKYEDDYVLLSKIQDLQSIDHSLAIIEENGSCLNNELYNLVVEID